MHIWTEQASQNGSARDHGIGNRKMLAFWFTPLGDLLRILNCNHGELTQAICKISTGQVLSYLVQLCVLLTPLTTDHGTLSFAAPASHMPMPSKIFRIVPRQFRSWCTPSLPIQICLNYFTSLL